MQGVRDFANKSNLDEWLRVEKRSHQSHDKALFCWEILKGFNFNAFTILQDKK